MKFHKFKKTKSFNLFCYIWTGFFATYAFVPFGYTHLIWLAPFGLFWLEEKYRGQYKKLFIQGFGISIILCFFSFYWINYMIVTFGGFPLWLAIILFILYAMAFNLKMNVYLILYSYLQKKIGRRQILIPGFTVLISELFTYQIFPWYWGNILAGDTILSQNVEYTGVYGLSFLLFTISYFLFKLKSVYYLRKKFRNTNFKIWVSAPILILLVFYINGKYLLSKWENATVEKKVNVMMIQPDAPLEFRDGRSLMATLDELLNRIEMLSIRGANSLRPDLIVLPESSVPFFSTHNTKATNSYNRSYWYRYEALAFLLANRFKSNVFLNEIDSIFKSGVEDRSHQRMLNNSVLFDPNGERKNSYAKSYLLAFGEYIPFGEEFEFLYSIVPQIGRFMPGTNHNLIPYYKPVEEIKFTKPHISWNQTKTIQIPELKNYYKENQTSLKEVGKLLPLICYEVILPEFVRKFRNSGEPDFIVNITNDKWYGKTIESYQHLELARLRSIEYRKWMVRSTNSGTSAFVDHLGRIVNEKFTGLATSTVYTEEISVIQSKKTFYVLYGNLLIYIFLVVTGLYYIYFIQKKKKN